MMLKSSACDRIEYLVTDVESDPIVTHPVKKHSNTEKPPKKPDIRKSVLPRPEEKTTTTVQSKALVIPRLGIRPKSSSTPRSRRQISRPNNVRSVAIPVTNLEMQDDSSHDHDKPSHCVLTRPQSAVRKTDY